MGMMENVYRIGIAGDWHGDLGWAIRTLNKFADRDVEQVFQLGDFGLWGDNSGRKYLRRLQMVLEHNNQHLWVVLGNHEQYPLVETYPVDEYGTFAPVERIHLLPRVFHMSIQNRNILMLGGAASINFDDLVLGRTWFLEEQITPENVEQVSEVVQQIGFPDLMLTHEAPSGGQPFWVKPEGFWSEEGKRYAEYSSHMMREAVDVAKPTQLWHGHYHCFSDKQHTFVDGEGTSYDTRVVCLGMNGQRITTSVVYDLFTMDYEVVNVLKLR